MTAKLSKSSSTKKSWTSIQSIIIILLISLIFGYMAYDSIIYRPKVNVEIKKLRGKYEELHTYMNIKFPEIDSTLKAHTIDLKKQAEQLDSLNKEINTK